MAGVYCPSRRLTFHLRSVDKGFVLASCAFIVAHILDYLLTVSGIQSTGVGEGNPIIQSYINCFGLQSGLLSYKLLMCTSLIIGMKAVDIANRKRGIKFRSKYVLYIGAILTVIGGSMWLYVPYI